MFKFIWHIENFSLLNQNTGEYIESPYFKIKSMNNLDAFIRLFPRGRTSINVISCFLCTPKDSQTLGLGTNVKLIFTNKTFSRVQERVVNEKNITELYLVVFRKEFDPYKNHPLSDDDIVIECNIQEGNVELWETCSARTSVQFEQHSYDLPISTSLVTIPNSWKRSLKLSKTVCHKQGTQELKFHINFTQSSFYYVTKIIRGSAPDIAATMFCKVSLFSPEKVICLVKREKFFKDKNDALKAIFGIRENDVSNFSFLRWELKFSNGIVISNLETNDLQCLTATPISCVEAGNKYNEILEHMYKCKKHCDVTLQVGSEKFLAHKSVLAAVSDVFAAMFETDMKEKQSCVVDITSMENVTIHKMLLFLYTGTTGNLDLKGLVKLYSASDKYQILNLKKVCSSELMMKLQIDNVCEILEIANLHQDQLLEDYARNFIFSNYKEICGTESWKSLMERKLQLTADLMLQICLRS